MSLLTDGKVIMREGVVQLTFEKHLHAHFKVEVDIVSENKNYINQTKYIRQSPRVRITKQINKISRTYRIEAINQINI